MTTTILIVLLDISIVILLMLFFVSLGNWQCSKKRDTELEKLLNDVMEQEESRKASIITYLVSHQKMSDQAALELSEDYVEAEKQFIYLFMEQLLKKNSVNGFYANLCDLLDKYLRLLPLADASRHPPAGMQEIQYTQHQSSAQQKETATQEIDWNETFFDTDDD